MKSERHSIYNKWSGMKQRCYNPNNKHYKDYSSKGIDVCPEWLNDSKAFFEWAVENGWRKGLWLDRIDKDKGYSPDNCVFISKRTNIPDRTPYNKNTIKFDVGKKHKKLRLRFKRFTRLLVLNEAEPHYTSGGHRERQWLCLCDCGKQVIVNTKNLRSGKTRSCGCLRFKKEPVMESTDNLFLDVPKNYNDDLIGSKFGLLTPIKRSKELYINKYNERFTQWECKCECGNIVTVPVYRLKAGRKSCGCLNHRGKRTHNLSGTPLYKVWIRLKTKCGCNPNKPFKVYKQSMCEEWQNSFESFYQWAKENDWMPRMRIRRKDENKPYSPENCTLKKKPVDRKDGTIFNEDDETYTATIYIDGMMQVIGKYETHKKALLARDSYIVEHNLKDQLLQTEEYSSYSHQGFFTASML